MPGHEARLRGSELILEANAEPQHHASTDRGSRCSIPAADHERSQIDATVRNPRDVSWAGLSSSPEYALRSVRPSVLARAAEVMQ
jgi:hypothetical protein